MDIQGLQKLTLLDFPGHVACTVFLAGCDFRCPFCHNWDLLDGSVPKLMDDTELLNFLKKRQGLLEGVAFTGGEPLLRKELPELFAKIRDLGYPIKLDTNGNHPDALDSIIRNKLVDYVAMDIKNSPDRYAMTIGLSSINLSPIQKSVEILKSSSIDYEFRTTVVEEYHDEDSFRSIGPWLSGAKQYFLQCFTLRDTVPDQGLTSPRKEAMETYLKIVEPFVSNVSLRGME